MAAEDFPSNGNGSLEQAYLPRDISLAATASGALAVEGASHYGAGDEVLTAALEGPDYAFGD